jgi:septal ring factor EnvC (AmiA/AmiB activator)
MAESNNLQGLASKITEIFTSATKGVEETTNKLNGLSTALENLSKVKTDDLDKFANNLKSVINFEKEYTQLATKKIELEKMSADAERTLIALNEKKNEVAKKNKATAEDLARITEKSIQQKQVELEAIKGVSTVIDGQIQNTRRLLIEKEKINSTTKEQTNLLKAEASAVKERNRTIEETAA